MLVASSDTHVGPPLEILRDYCEHRHLEEFDAFARSAVRRAGFVARPNDAFDWDEIVTPGHYDVHERLRQLDADGVAAEVIFHGSQNGQPIPFLSVPGSFSLAPSGNDSQHDRELAHAGMRIYNRWLADFCSVEPERHVGLAYLPLWDLDLAASELEWARDAGLRGVNFPAPRRSLPDYNDPVWEPFWSACETYGMPLNTHSGSETSTSGLAQYEGEGAWRLLLLDRMLFNGRALPWMIFGGVFERHPGLKLVLTEMTGLSAWLPLNLRAYDEVVIGPNGSGEPTGFPRMPSDYFRSNCYVGASCMSSNEARGAVEQDLVGNYLWGSDFPHREGSYPWTRQSLRMTFEKTDLDVMRRIVGGNLVAAFGLDADALQRVADRVGPTVDELVRPLGEDEMPTEPSWIRYTAAFRHGTFWA